MILRRHRRKARRVFISYSRRCGQAHAVPFFRGLEQVLGTRDVFLDVAAHAMEAGRPWTDSVREALASCDRIISELTGRIPGQVPVVDRWDLTVLGVLALLGLIA